MRESRSFEAAAAAVIAMALLAGPAPAADKKPAFSLVSPGHKEFTHLTAKYAAEANNCGGQNVSPALTWSGAPAATKSYAIALIDPASPALTGFLHWIAYGIPATKTSLKEGEASKPSSEFTSGKNGPGGEGYFGPCPPPGQKPHPFTFLLMATDLPPDALQPGLSRDELAAGLKGHVLDRTTLVLQYGR
ncbi:MAG TPA: YbhB/YbcL family Raf kinase inhibitor-like protein [Stellaceae bacterium]|nr:YbhB/YbcL family Raf kinase inhibitor-like protein [Stellaceae bacterium]